MQSLDEFIDKIRSLGVQGAKEIAIESLKFLRSYAKENGFNSKFGYASKKIENVRTTAVILHNCLEIVKREKSIESINRLLRKMSQMDNEIAKRGGPLIKDGYSIMTHCHSSEVCAVIKNAWKTSKKITVYVTETRPRNQGIITAQELSKEGINVVLITDSAIGYFIKDVDIVIVGCDAFRKEGVVNKIGTYSMAIVAREHKKPFYVVGNTLKIDKRKNLIIEERSPNEIYHEHMKTLKIRNPAFDITPLKYVKRIICEKGIMTPGEFLKLHVY